MIPQHIGRKLLTSKEKIDSVVEQVLQKFQDIFEVSVIQDKSKEVLSVEFLSLEADALTIVRLCEDLLSISRTLKETWCLGTLKVNNTTQAGLDPESFDGLFKKFNELTDRIAKVENDTTYT